MAEVIRYIIDLKPDQVEKTAKLLADVSVRFDHAESMIAMPRDNIEEGIFTGAEGEWVRERINEHLDATGDLSRISQPFEGVTPLAQRDLLTLATFHCAWVKDEVQEMDPPGWQKFREDHPETVEYQQPEEKK